LTNLKIGGKATGETRKKARSILEDIEDTYKKDRGSGPECHKCPTHRESINFLPFRKTICLTTVDGKSRRDSKIGIDTG
jgi:hypothetical protein